MESENQNENRGEHPERKRGRGKSIRNQLLRELQRTEGSNDPRVQETRLNILNRLDKRKDAERDNRDLRKQLEAQESEIERHKRELDVWVKIAPELKEQVTDFIAYRAENSDRDENLCFTIWRMHKESDRRRAAKSEPSATAAALAPPAPSRSTDMSGSMSKIEFPEPKATGGPYESSWLNSRA